MAYAEFLKFAKISTSDLEFDDVAFDSAASPEDSDDDSSESDDSSEVEEETGDIFFTVTA